MAVITQDVIKQATVAITAGADGIYYSTQAIQDDRLDHHDFKELVEKYDRQIIRAANQLSDTNILHICGNGGAYIAYFRGIPLVIHLFIVYYGLPVLLTAILPPLLGVSTVKLQRLNPLYAIIISYTPYTAAFMSEIIRGAYQAVDRQQLDAAQALGYTSWQTYRFIKLPQALVEALPKLLNYYLLLIRQLSLAFLVSFIDIFAQAQLQSAVNYRYIEAYCAAALTYWLIGIVLTLLFGWWEKHLKKYQLNR